MSESEARLLTKEEWAKETFAGPGPFNPWPIIASFVAGHSDIYLFKNRSGQWIFQTYSPASGNPTTGETVFLLHGKPDGSEPKPGIMPKHLEVKKWGGIAIVGLEADATTAEKLEIDLSRACELLLEVA